MLWSVGTRSGGGDRPLWCMRRLVTTLLLACTTAAAVGAIVTMRAVAVIEIGPSTMTEAIVAVDRDSHGGVGRVATNGHPRLGRSRLATYRIGVRGCTDWLGGAQTVTGPCASTRTAPGTAPVSPPTTTTQ